MELYVLIDERLNPEQKILFEQVRQFVSTQPSSTVLLDGYLISYFRTGLKNLLGRAILESQDFHQTEELRKYKKLDEIPFDFTRRMMSVLVEDPEGQAILLTKGAPEEVFSCCTRILSSTELCLPSARTGSSG